MPKLPVLKPRELVSLHSFKLPFARIPHPGGMTAISRWSSAATPPEHGPRQLSHPGGMPEVGRVKGVHASVNVQRSLPSLRDGLGTATCSRWCRCAQPPANYHDPCRGRTR